MKLDVNIDIKLPVITNNFENVKTQLIDGLKQYDLITYSIFLLFILLFLVFFI